MRSYVSDLYTAFARVFTRAGYIVLASALALAAFLFAVWFPNFALIGEVFGTPDVALIAKLRFALSLLGGIATNFDLLSAGYTVAIAVLFGINTAMIAYLLTQKRVVAAGQNLVIGSGGMATGALGIGCAACGSLVFTTVLSSFGAASAVALLPWQGEEFGILGAALLLVSVSLMSRKIAAPGSCETPARGVGRTRDRIATPVNVKRLTFTQLDEVTKR
ncbi:MAG TPA: hypothetical protein VGA88_06970 [Burkholderiales bacterium]